MLQLRGLVNHIPAVGSQLRQVINQLVLQINCLLGNHPLDLVLVVFVFDGRAELQFLIGSANCLLARLLTICVAGIEAVIERQVEVARNLVVWLGGFGFAAHIC